MAQEKIIIRFKAEGNKPLINAIKQLDIATKRLEGKTSLYEKELRKLNAQQHLVDKRMSSNVKSGNKLQATFATLRNKLL